MTHNLMPKRNAVGRRTAAIGALGLIASLALAGCSGEPEGYYIEGWWDNGDPYYAPSKSALFDEDGNPTCDFPVMHNQFESRAGAIKLAAGVAFEIMNREPDPDGFLDPTDFPTEADKAKERLRRERAQNSLEVLWQYTHPQFDAAYGIEGPQDLEETKKTLQADLFGLGSEGQYVDYLELTEIFFISDSGTFTVERLGNPTNYMEERGIPLQFLGLVYEYYHAFNVEDEDDEFLLVLEKETAETTLWVGDQQSPLGEAIWYARVEVRVGFVTFTDPAYPVYEFLLQSDGCPDQDGRGYQRYYLRSYTKLEIPVDDDDVEPAPEPSPSA